MIGRDKSVDGLWQSSEEVAGYDLGQFTPCLEDLLCERTRLEMWSEQLRRTLILQRQPEDAIIHDVLLQDFRLDAGTWHSSKLQATNSKYHQDQLSGLANLSTSYYGVEQLLSQPHCLDCEALATVNVVGQAPSTNKHGTFYGVEPFTGQVMNSMQRQQVNFLVSPTDHFYPAVATTVVPFMWREQGELLSKSRAKLFRDVVQTQLQRAAKLLQDGIIVGSLSMILGLFITIWAFWKGNKTAKIDPNPKLIKNEMPQLTYVAPREGGKIAGLLT